MLVTFETKWVQDFKKEKAQPEEWHLQITD